MSSPNFEELTETSTVEETREVIRTKRASCFDVVNRGLIWYETITPDQKAELIGWYQAWLDAPQTLIIPEKPTWLK